MLLSYNLAAAVHFPTRVQNQSCRAIDNIFTDKYKFTQYTASPIYNGLSDHDAQLLTIKDINLQTLNHSSYSIRNINILWKNLKLDRAMNLGTAYLVILTI
jgi:hypothetical protein